MTSPGIARFLREPMVYFLALTVALFAVYAARNDPRRDDPREIVVERASLVRFQRVKANVADAGFSQAPLEDLTLAERRALLRSYVEEEALYREAVALGLERNDYIVRRRLVQKLEQLIESTVTASFAPSAEQLEAYYETFAADYAEPAVYTFTHVFFDRAQRGDEGARAAALAALDTLAGRPATAETSAELGDRPLYGRRYENRTRDFVRGYLGDAVVAALDAADAAPARWLGPVQSPYGWHLLLPGEREAGRVPPLADVEARVRDDYRRYEADRLRREATEAIVASYTVDVRED